MTGRAEQLGFDELLAIGEMDEFLKKAEKKCKAKIKNTVFAGRDHEDVVQDVLTKLYVNIGKYDKSKAKVSTFVDHILENGIKDVIKECSAGKNLLVVNAVSYQDSYENDWEDSEGESVEQAHVGYEDQGFENTEFLFDLMENIGLNDREKKVVVLRSQGYDKKEIAEKLGISQPRMTQILKAIKGKYFND